MMFVSIARFELRYQLKNPVFWVSAAIFFLLGFGISASANVSIGTPGSVHENSPYAISVATAVMGLFYLFVITSFVANAVVRDDVTGFSPMIRATPITRGQFLAGRFLGGLAVAILGYMAVPIGIGVGASMPWVDPETVGPGGLAAYAWPFLIIAIPNILLSSAFLFALTTMTRSMLASYVGVLVFVMGYLIVNSVLGPRPEYQDVLAQFEPMAMGALEQVTRYWTADDMNGRLLPLAGNLLFNRLVVLALSALFLGVTWQRFSMTERAPSKRRLRKIARDDRKLAKAAAVLPVTGGQTVTGRAGSAQAVAAIFRQRLKTEVLLVLKSPGLIVLLLIALIYTGTALAFAETQYGTPSYPLTANVISTVMIGMTLFTVVVAVFYGGELVWRERDTRINEIVDSTPAPAWAIFVPKILAILAVLLAMTLGGMAMGVAYQLSRGVTHIEWGSYLAWLVLPQSIDLLAIAILSVFVQVVSPNKYVGWGVMLVWFVSRVFLSNLGYSNMLYIYGGGPTEPLSDMNGSGFWAGAMWGRLYWGCFGLILLVLAHWMWPRGTVVAVRPRIAGIGRRITPVSATLAALGLAGMVGSGILIHHNIAELNLYRTKDQIEKQTADYERRYLKYENLPRPVVTDVAFNVALDPARRRMDVTGRYVLRNETQAPIWQVHVRQSDDTVDFTSLALAGARLAFYDKLNGYRIYRFDTPLLPGRTATLDFRSTIWRRGFENGEPHTDLVENGSFVNNFVFAPVIGMTRDALLTDRTARRRQGLPDELRPASLDDTSAQRENYVHADWVNSRIVLSTSADQVPIAPGNKISDVTRNGRRTATFVSPAPILNFFSIQSARYAEAHDDHAGIRLSVYHDPRHAWNVPKMLAAMKASLDYYTAHFGPYQFDYARIIEFPGYSTFAQAFAGTVPYSESIGFAADVRDPDKIDYVSYVTAHELAHQYWAHQVVGGAMQGDTLLSETMAQYSALMVMKRLYGPDKIRRFLKYELDQYLSNRKGERLQELPLYRVEDQGYIHYRKGSLVMYLLQQRLGEDAVDRALARFLARYRFEGAPYPRSVDLIAEFCKEAHTPEQQALITDLFERITIYDLKADNAKVTKNPDGSWTTTLTIDAAKYYADGKGTERSASLREPIEVGLFKQKPGQGVFDRSDVIAMARQDVVTGRQRIVLRSAQKPAFAGVDPYNFYIDRNSDDNVVAVD
ncbi:M1 family aminopeptidase [Novosphingobium sp. 9U]|uniref:ABC transporter permease/M1 family aminopeptidase n=1 Tax=Novosphingobium sp. 9U TaxID=2653158 RepID=UPI0012F34F5C|nr:M1 family aminopeptidase [Novosphingobium sp. 9U]VWX47237.1 Aminopeptidase [Novosphingobium sp. 9U]